MGIREDIRNQFEGLSQTELIIALKEVGFNVTKGTGEITILEDELDDILIHKERGE